MESNLDYVWTLIAGILVFFMQAGFMALESGLVRSKNLINVAIKNFMDFMISTATFWIIGFPIMFGTTYLGIIGGAGDFFTEFLNSQNDPKILTFWFFHVVFAGTAATIVSGAVAERTKFGAYLIVSVFVSALIYPIFGHWAWGNLLFSEQNGWLGALGFYDFAGSTVVHSIGGWTALIGAYMVGPRIGKYTQDGKVNKIPAHNLALATLGVFILWFGWFGFNGGSSNKGTAEIGKIIVNTNLAAAFGGLTALFGYWMVKKKPVVEYALNGVLAGLVSITASADNVSPSSAILIGIIGGIIVNLSLSFVDRKLKVDDPVGAIAVHGFCGVWGTLAVAFFIPENLLPTKDWLSQLGVQALGVATALVWAVTIGFIIFWILKKTIGIRVSAEDEKKGLNFAEHGASTTLTDTAVKMKEITEFKGDLTMRIDAELGDETGEIGILFNELLEWLHSVIVQFSDYSGKMTSVSEILIENVKTSEININEMLISMDKVNESAESQEEIVKETKETLEKTNKRTSEMAERVENQSVYVKDSALAIEKMQTIIQDVSTMAGQAHEISTNLLNVATTGGEDIRSEIQGIREIEKSSQQVVEIVAIIETISSKTNLLAMNASIEAARAGTAGKGFAVVATEIRKLATNTAHSAKSISDIVNAMILKINLSVQNAEKADNALNSILTDSQRVSNINTQIADATHKQMQFSKEILSAEHALVNITDSISDAMIEQKADSEKIEKINKTLVEVAQRIKEAVESQIKNSYQVLESVKIVEQNAEDGNSMSKDLSNLIGQFKLS